MYIYINIYIRFFLLLYHSSIYNEFNYNVYVYYDYNISNMWINIL